jgi:hypothetical protein
MCIQQNSTIGYVKCRYAECGDYLSVTLSVIMLNAIMLNAIMLSVIMLSAIRLSAIKLSVIILSVNMLSVVKLSVVAPFWRSIYRVSFCLCLSPGSKQWLNLNPQS